MLHDLTPEKCFRFRLFKPNQIRFILQVFNLFLQVFFKENVRNLVWICRDPISLILGARFFLILGTRS